MSLHVCMCVCVCIKEAVRKLTCHLITEISWTDSSADEWLRINRLLFSLNSCLSTSLIKTRGRGEKIKPANENRFQLISFSLEDENVTQQLHSPARRGSCSTTHVHIRAEALGYGSIVFVNLTLVYSLSIKSSRAEYIAAAD